MLQIVFNLLKFSEINIDLVLFFIIISFLNIKKNNCIITLSGVVIKTGLLIKLNIEIKDLCKNS